MPVSNDRINILGVEVDRLSITEAIDRIIKQTEESGAVFVVKPYVEFFNRDHSQLLNQAWLCLADGVALQWAAYFQTTSGSWWQFARSVFDIVAAPHRLRQVLPDKFAGTNFTWPLLEAAAANNKSIYLVGSPMANDISHTADTISQHLPGISIAGTLPGRDADGTFSAALEDKLLVELERLRPDIVLIGLGFPRQEQVMQRLCPRLDHGVLIGEGGTFDYQGFGGKHRKAPEFMQRAGLEWLWRLLLQPGRLKRQLVIPRFMWRVFRFTNDRSKTYHRNN